MRALQFISKTRAAVLIAILSLALTGCFDLTQKVDIGRTGAGHYRVAIAAQGIVGEALKEKPANVGDNAKTVTTVTDKNGTVTQTSTVFFDKLSDLKLSDELISLHVLGRSFFGLGPTHVRFRRTFLIGNARRDNAQRMGRDDAAGAQIMASLFGNHTYVFSVTLPGSILRAVPLKLGNVVVEPTITGDFYHGHTVTWTMPLYLALNEKVLSFEADFSAYGSFADSQSVPEDTASL